MLGALFGFSGRMGRLAYFGWSVAMGLFAGLGIVLSALGLVAGISQGAGGALAGTGLAIVIGLVLLAWMGSALATKRLRDAGLSPGIVLPLMSAFSVFDAMVLSQEMAEPSLVASLAPHSPVGLAVKGLFGLVLLLWPSADATSGPGSEETRETGEAVWHERALKIASMPLPPREPARALAPPVHISATAARTFGRRVAR